MSTKAFQRCAHDGIDHDLIRRYLLVEQTVLRPADVAMVFGNKDVIEQLASRAIELYQRRLVKKVIVTGGNEVSPGESEAEAIASSLLNYVPPEDIVLENQSTNTQENIEKSQKTYNSLFPDNPVQSAICVGHIMAGRRFLMTMARRWPEVSLMASNVNPFNTPLNKWDTDPAVKSLILEEYAKIKPYLECGFLEEIDLGEINAASIKQLPCRQLIR